MKIVLRIIAIVVGVAVILTAITVVRLAWLGALGVFVRSGALGLTTITGWIVILTAGPVAAIQLWRLRRLGLFATAMLCVIACAYYIVGFLFLRSPEAPLAPIFGAVAVNAAVLCLLLSSPARRRVS
jgi:surface polysaccharide O-acyltransferase-like enzyme